MDDACMQEWFAMKTGWSSGSLCHHCHCLKTSHATVPGALYPRRDLDNFVQHAARTGDHESGSLQLRTRLSFFF